jgi:hypothetical protein
LHEIVQPSDPRPNIRRMFYALLICSDDDCPDELETTGTLEELESLACDCGCTLQVVAVSEVEFAEPVWEWEYALAAAA